MLGLFTYGEPQLHVTIVAAFGIGHSEQEAFRAVQKSNVQDIGAKEGK